MYSLLLNGAHVSKCLRQMADQNK